MMLTLSQTERAKKLAQNNGCSFYSDYSGRGMYGKHCIGFSGNSEVAMSCASKVKRWKGLNGQRVCSDSLGLGIIVYLPYVTSYSGAEN